MHRNAHWVLLLCLCCSSCETGLQQKVAVPPAPQPIAKPAPVVVSQTVAQLPDPQPVPPDSIPPRPPVEYQPPVKEAEVETESPPDPKSARQPPKTSRPARRTADTPPEVAAPSTPATPIVEEPPAPERLSAAGEPSLSKETVNATLAEVQQSLKELAARPKTSANVAAVTRIRSLVKLAEQSVAKNDLRQGDTLAHRALALAHDLAGPK
jgi:hypothetical protein